MEVVGNYLVIQSIVLPDKTYYGFIYDAADPNNASAIAYGTLSKIILPTGGSIAYQYAMEPACEWPDGMSLFAGNAMWSTLHLIKRIEDDGRGHQYTWNYSSGLVTDPDQNETVYTFDPGPSYPLCGPGVEKRRDLYQGSSTSGTLLSSVITTNQFTTPPVNIYTDNSEPQLSGAFPTQVQTFMDGQLASTAVTGYDSSFAAAKYDCVYGGSCTAIGTETVTLGIPTSQSVIDPSLGVLTSSQMTYRWQSDGTTGPVYKTANLLDIPSIVTVTNGSGVQAEQTTTQYDESPYSPQSGQALGRATTVSRWNSSGGSIQTHTAWTSTGMVDHTVDARQNTNAQYTYGSQYSGLYPTIVTNALGQQSSYGYDFNSGLVTSMIDSNHQTTSYTYDTSGRVRTVLFPDGGQTTFSYSPDNGPITAQNPPSVTQTVATGEPSGSFVTTTIYDGLARKIATQLQSDPIGVVNSDITYDAFDRVISSSNPYRSPGELTYGIISYAYDALGRMRRTCQQDNGNNLPCSAGNSYLRWDPSGNTTDYYDETSRHWRRTYDALGRIVKVLEPDSSNTPTIETDYQYDPLGNLTRVDQWGGPINSSGDLIRQFSYDSLSRLITAYNPESGWTCYGQWSGPGTPCINGYDGNGNLVLKTNAGGVVTTYSYDQGNRLVSKSYSDQTPRVDYGYDNAGTWGGSQTNLVGRLSYACTGDGPGCNGSPETRIAYGYDAMGRVIRKVTCSPANCGGNPYVQTYIYGAAGQLRSWDTGVPSLPAFTTFTAEYDSALHLKSLTPSKAGQQLSPIYTAQPWGPFGITDAAFGSNLTLHRDYDIRGRVYHEKDNGMVVTQ